MNLFDFPSTSHYSVAWVKCIYYFSINDCSDMTLGRYCISSLRIFFRKFSYGFRIMTFSFIFFINYSPSVPSQKPHQVSNIVLPPYYKYSINHPKVHHNKGNYSQNCAYTSYSYTFYHLFIIVSIPKFIIKHIYFR